MILKKIKYIPALINAIKELDSFWAILTLPFAKWFEPTIQLKDGTKFRINHYSDLLTIKEVYLDNAYKLKHSYKTIIDIGGNIGTFSVFAKKKFPKARLITFEPAKKTFALLSENLRINGCHDAQLFNTAVGGKVGLISFFSVDQSGLGSMYNVRKNSKTYKVKVQTLESIFNWAKIQRCNFLKVDCEGAEYEIFLSARMSTLNKIDKIYCEYHDKLTKYNHAVLVDLFCKSGFRVKIIPHPIEDDIGIIEAVRNYDKS